MNVAKPRAKLQGIQIARGLTALAVIVEHYALTVGDYSQRESLIATTGLTNALHSAVDVFFVMSGFILAIALREEGGARDAVRSFDRRLRRLFPLYWVWTTAVLAIWVSGAGLKSHSYSPSFILSSYLLVPMWNGVNFHPVLDQAWTLSFEVVFYACFAIATFLVPSWRKFIVVTALLATVNLLGRAFIPYGTGVHYLTTDLISIDFVLGMIAGETFRWLRSERFSDELRSRLSTVMLVGGLLLVLSTALYRADEAWRALFWGVPAFMIVLGSAFADPKPGRVINYLIYIGDASYSIYLTHGFILILFSTALKRVGFLKTVMPDPYIIVLSLITTAVCALSHDYIEKPLGALIMKGSKPRAPALRPATVPVDAQKATSTASVASPTENA